MRRALLVAVAACGTAAAPAAAPVALQQAAPADAARDAFVADCDAMVAGWRAEVGLDDADAGADAALIAELAERRAGFACTLAADLDGDGRADRVVVGRGASSGASGFEAQLADGRRLRLGAGEPTEVWPIGDDGGMTRRDDDYGWVVAWSVAAGRGRDGADALVLSGGDAAALFGYDGARWTWLHLGY